MSELQQEIEQFFEEYSKRWNSQDYGTLGELWDRDDELPFYRPMEVENFIAGWDRLEKYWNPVPGKRIIGGLWNIYTNLRPKLIGPDVAVVTFDLEWDLKPPGSAKAISGTDPGMAVLKRKPEGWRLVAYVEACMHRQPMSASCSSGRQGRLF
jgi:hypothetical protein